MRASRGILTKPRRRPSYADVVSTLCLFLILSGGTAMALSGTNTVFSDDIVNDEVKGADVNESSLDATPLRTRVAKGGCEPVLSGTGTMVRVGPICMDKYEASVWSKRTGGTQYGVSSDNYPCNDNGQNCKGKIYARSVGGVTPSRFITWFQAQQALANSFKRLPENAEWQMAVAGTPDAGPDNGTTTCNTTLQSGQDPVKTGSRSACVSAYGAYDMVGNAWEWVADWVHATAQCASWGSFSNDWMCLRGTSTSVAGPAALLRGGFSGDGTSAGPFALTGFHPPSDGSNQPFGFRGAR